MAIKITSAAALQRMQNAITQGYKAFEHNMEHGTKVEWQLAVATLRLIRKRAIEKNEKVEAIKNG